MLILTSLSRSKKPYIQIRKGGEEARRAVWPDASEKLEASLSRVKDYVFYADENAAFEKKWTDIKRRYKEIVIQKQYVNAIGELLPRYYAMTEENKDPNALYVQLPALDESSDRVANKYAQRYIGVCDRKETEFWLYVIRKYPEKLNLRELEKFRLRGRFPCYRKKAESIKHNFSEKEIADGEDKRTKMGLRSGEEYICVAARSASYNVSTLENKKDFDYGYRNSDFDSYGEALAYTKSVGLKAVKMGRFEYDERPGVEYIDYAGKHAEDFMDLFLVSGCKFFLTGQSGIFTIAMLFAKPVLMVNAVDIFFGNGGMRYTQYDMFIPKQFYDKKKKRYLTFKELFEFQKKCPIASAAYENANIKVVDNSQGEILDAAKEMMDKLQGTWISADEDKMLMKKYTDIYIKAKEFQRKNGANWIGEPIMYRPAASYLRKHRYLLE